MKQTITPTTLIKYIYKETSYLENLMIQSELKKQEELTEELENIQETHDLLDTVKVEPPASIIQNILNYSGRSQFEAEPY